MPLLPIVGPEWLLFALLIVNLVAVNWKTPRTKPGGVEKITGKEERQRRN